MSYLRKYFGFIFVLLVVAILLIGLIQLKKYWDYQAYLRYRQPLVAVEVRDKDPYVDERGVIKQAPLLSGVSVKLVYQGERRLCPAAIGYDCPGPLNIALESVTDANGLAYFYNLDIQPIIIDGGISPNCIMCVLQVYIDDGGTHATEAVDINYRQMVDGFYLDNPIELEL